MRLSVLAVLAIAMGLAGLLASETALAHGGRARVHFGITLGAPLYWRGWYPPPYYYYPPSVVVVPAAPPPAVYVERDRTDAAPASQDSGNWWYFCRETNAYYPYVKQCPGGWERVSPQPPAS